VLVLLSDHACLSLFALGMDHVVRHALVGQTHSLGFNLHGLPGVGVEILVV
jgi:hypothetical protein